MARPSKEGRYATYKLDTETLNILEEYSKSTMIPKTRIIEAAVKEYVKNRQLKSKQ